MTPPMRNSHPLPPMDETEDNVAGNDLYGVEMRRQQRLFQQYVRNIQARIIAEAIGRPYPDERHAVWPR